jgi:hypothetical protein
METFYDAINVKNTKTALVTYSILVSTIEINCDFYDISQPKLQDMIAISLQMESTLEEI